MSSKSLACLSEIISANGHATPERLASVPRQLLKPPSVERSLRINAELELATKASRVIERANDPFPALQCVAYLFATSLPVAYCRLLLMAEDGQSLIVCAAYAASAGLHWEPHLGQSVPVSQLPDGTCLSRMTYNLVGLSRRSLVQQQLRGYALTLGLQEPLRLLLLVPLKIEERLLWVLEFGELERDQTVQLDKDKVRAVIVNARELIRLIHKPWQVFSDTLACARRTSFPITNHLMTNKGEILLWQAYSFGQSYVSSEAWTPEILM